MRGGDAKEEDCGRDLDWRRLLSAAKSTPLFVVPQMLSPLSFLSQIPHIGASICVTKNHILSYM